MKKKKIQACNKIQHCNNKLPINFARVETLLTAQVGSRASIVGESPRYKPFKPSVFIIFRKLVTITLPEYRQKGEAEISIAYQQ